MKLSILMSLVALAFFANKLIAQDEGTEKESKLNFSAGADVYSSYLWRGSKYAGPSIQPTVKMEVGGLTLGVWGSYGGKSDPDLGLVPYVETDPYISYSFPFGLSLGLSDYYYEGDFTDVSDTSGSQAFEVNLGFVKGPVTLSANYILNEAGGAASKGGDMYFQFTYAFSKFSAFIGAGNGWHTLDNEKGDDVFNICNLGISTSKTIEITEKFSMPVSGQVVFNPDTKQLFAAVGFSFNSNYCKPDVR